MITDEFRIMNEREKKNKFKRLQLISSDSIMEY